jgi:hypothetical protein
MKDAFKNYKGPKYRDKVFSFMVHVFEDFQAEE